MCLGARKVLSFFLNDSTVAAWQLSWFCAKSAEFKLRNPQSFQENFLTEVYTLRAFCIKHCKQRGMILTQEKSRSYGHRMTDIVIRCVSCLCCPGYDNRSRWFKIHCVYKGWRNKRNRWDGNLRCMHCSSRSRRTRRTAKRRRTW